MRRILIISAVLLAVVFTATADRRRLMLARNVAPCATSDTTLPHDTLLEGFNVSSTGYENSWADGGTGTSCTFDPAADTSAFSGRPVGACNQALKITHVAADAGEQTKFIDFGSIDVDTINTDLRFYIVVTAIPDGAEAPRFISFTQTTSPNNVTDQSFRVVIEADGSNFKLAAAGTTVSSYFTGLAVNTFHLVEVHLDTTGASSTFNVNSGSAATFTRRAAVDPRYLHVGAVGNQISGDSYTAYLDLIAVNTP